MTFNASATRNLSTDAKVISGGGVVAGVGVAETTANGSTQAFLGNYAQIGQQAGNSVGGVNIAATSEDTITATAYGVSAGAGGAATGVDASAQSDPTILTAIGDNSAITAAGSVTVMSQDIPNTNATAFGVAVGLGIGVGAVVSDANNSGTTSSYLGNEVTVRAAALVLDAGNEPTAYSMATAGVGGALAGINATVSTATSDGSVQASTGTSVTLPDGDVTIEANNTSEQSANATGVAVGGYAAGVDVATANSAVTTLAQLGTGVITDSWRTGRSPSKRTEMTRTMPRPRPAAAA